MLEGSAERARDEGKKNGSHTQLGFPYMRMMAVWITCVSSRAEALETQHITEARDRAAYPSSKTDLKESLAK